MLYCRLVTLMGYFISLWLAYKLGKTDCYGSPEYRYTKHRLNLLRFVYRIAIIGVSVLLFLATYWNWHLSFDGWFVFFIWGEGLYWLSLMLAESLGQNDWPITRGEESKDVYTLIILFSIFLFLIFCSLPILQFSVFLSFLFLILGLFRMY